MRVLGTGAVGALLMGCVGLLCGVLYSVGGFFVDLFTIGLNWGTVLAFGALIGMPVIFAAVGFIVRAIGAVVVVAVRAVVRGAARG